MRNVFSKPTSTNPNYYEVENFFIDTESFFSYPYEFMTCNSVPKIKKRIVRSLSEAKTIYLKEVAFVSHLDSETEQIVPPDSILTDIYLQKEILYIVKLPTHQLGSYAYTMIMCHIIDNTDWLNGFYNKYIDQNNKVLVAVIDIVYRLGLCLRNLDYEVNCPDACHLKSEKCKNMGNSTGTCQNVIPAKLSDYVIGQVKVGEIRSYETIKSEFLLWYVRIPRNKKLPAKLFNSTLASTEKLLLQLIGLQFVAILDGQCNCKMYFKYEFFSDSCVEDFDAIFCKSVNVCKNGGECERAKDDNGIPLNSVKCICQPAYKGEFCELERNPCAELPPSGTCGEFTCIRDANKIKQGFRCRCPKNAYKVDTLDNAKCIDVNECETTKPCKNGAICQNLVGSYFCACRTGFEGQNCEILPPDPLWSEWSEWSSCNIPSKSEICFQMPYRLQSRECQTNVIKQRCIGPRRRLQYECPGVQMDDIYHFCSQSNTDNVVPLTEYQLGETIDYYVPDDLGEDEEMSQRDIDGPENLPKSKDVVYFMLCMLIVVLQIFFIYKWVTVVLFVFGAPRKTKQFVEFKFEETEKIEEHDEIKEKEREEFVSDSEKKSGVSQVQYHY